MDATAWVSQMIISRIVIKGLGFCNNRRATGYGKVRGDRSSLPFSGFFADNTYISDKSLRFIRLVPTDSETHACTKVERS